MRALLVGIWVLGGPLLVGAQDAEPVADAAENAGDAEPANADDAGPDDPTNADDAGPADPASADEPDDLRDAAPENAGAGDPGSADVGRAPTPEDEVYEEAYADVVAEEQQPDPPPEEEEEEERDHFRAFYLEISLGYVWANLGVLRQDNLVPELQSVQGSGYGFGAGFGFFVSFLTLGVQAEYARHDGFDIGTATLDLGIRIPTPHIEPYLRAGVGYAWLSNLRDFPRESDDPIRGVAVDVGAGFDFQLSRAVALGIGVDVALFNVRRRGVEGIPSPSGVVLTEDGDALGIQVSTLAQLSFHF